MTRTVLWLGASDDACQNYPTTLDKSTLAEYGKRCGKAKLKEWLLKQTGVDVGKCLDSSASLEQSPECIANNYGIKLGVIKDGEVQWDVVVNDAGAIGGIAVCAATGVGAAGLSLCGKVGAALTNIAYGLVEPFVAEFVKLFWGEPEKIVNCNLNAPVDLINGWWQGAPAQYRPGSIGSLVQWLAYPGLQSLPGAIGPLITVPGKAYWSKILIMRGLATASAIVLRDFAEQTGLPTAKAIGVLDLKAPPGWVELVRPEYDGKPHDDAKLNVGALLDAFMAPEVIRKARGEDVIVPSYLLPAFWNGIPSASGVTNFFELQNVNEGCFTAIMWGKRDPKIPKPTGPAYQRAKMQVYWEYTTPTVVNALALSDNFKFLAAMKTWRDSLKQNLTAKIAQGRALAAPKKSSSLVPVLLVGGAAALAWWLWPAAGLFENPSSPGARSTRLRPGPGYEWRYAGGAYWNNSSDDEWKEVEISKGTGRTWLGQREIAGKVVNVFNEKKTGWYFAQVATVNRLKANPTMPRGATLRNEDGWWVLRFREGGFRKFLTQQEAKDYVGGLAP